MQMKILKCLTILLLSLVLSMTCLNVSEAKVEAINNKIVMDVQDAIDLYRYIAQLEAENKALKDGLDREREAIQDYMQKTNGLVQKYEEERAAWEMLEKQMNIELQSQKAKMYKTSAIALLIGGIVGAVVSD